jgi:hypothetical protein
VTWKAARPRHGIPEAFDERREPFEIGFPRHERDALFTARRSDQRIVEKRRFLAEQLPTLSGGEGREPLSELFTKTPTKSSARSIASVSVSTPSARRATSSFR